jgi:hypothetical protein
MNDPRTHVYVSILPLFLLAAFGLSKLVDLVTSKFFKYFFLTLVTCFMGLISVFNWTVFVDKSPEYPWWDKDYLPNTPAYRIKRVYHQKIEGVFGFNNYRGWEQIASLYDRGCMVGTFDSNEKNSITYFYIRQDQKKGEELEMPLSADNLVIVNGPHSWVYYKPENLPSNKKLIKTIFENGYPLTYIYAEDGYYPNNKLLCE